MKVGGILLFLLGAGLLLAAFLMKTSVPSYSAYSSSSDIINIGLLQNQLMVWQLGLALLVMGSVLFAAGSVVDLLREADILPQPPAVSADSQNRKCDWCGVTFRYPLTPCSAVTPEQWKYPETKVTLERCKEELTARGIAFNST